MLAFISFLSSCLAYILNFIMRIEVDPGVNIASLLFIVVCIALILGFLLPSRSGDGSSDTYRPRHSYLPKHERRE